MPNFSPIPLRDVVNDKLFILGHRRNEQYRTNVGIVERAISLLFYLLWQIVLANFRLTMDGTGIAVNRGEIT